MATYTQSQNSVGSSYYNYFLSQVPVGKDYIIFSTSDDYMCVYGDFEDGSFKDSTVISIARSYNQGVVTVKSENSTTVNTSYDYYVYSNVGKGTLLISPHENLNNIQVQHFTCIAAVLILFIIIGFSVIKKRWI